MEADKISSAARRAICTKASGPKRSPALAGSAVFTDARNSYEGLDDFQHEVIDHAVEYARGEVHANGLENFWSLLKRGIHGTYVSVEPFHLFRYLDEQAFRYDTLGIQALP